MGGGTPPSHTLALLGRYAPSGLVASLPREDCAPPNVLAHYATEDDPGVTGTKQPSQNINWCNETWGRKAYDDINHTRGYQVKICHFVQVCILFFRAVFGFKMCQVYL